MMIKQFHKPGQLLCLLAFISLAIACQPTNPTDKTEQHMNQSTMTSPPEAEKIPKELSIHGDTRIDNYYWMNDREDPKVISYLNAENDYTTQSLQHTEPLQKQLYDEIIARIKQDDISVPYKDNGYYYLTRYESSKEYPIYVRKKGSLDAEEEITLDVNQLAEGFDYFAAVGLSVSPNNQLLAYGEDTLSRRIYTVRVKNMVDGQLLEDAIPNTTGRVIWANDNKTFFYTVKDKTLRAYKIFKHRLGTPASEDVEIFHESDETFSCYVYKSRSDKYIIIGSYQTLSNEFRFIDADTPDAEFRVFQPRQRNLEYNIEHDGDKFYVRTNLDARNFRLMETPVNATSKDNWKEVIPHREDVLLGDVDAFKDFMALSERKNGITQLRIRHKNGDDHSVAFKEDAYLAYVSTNREFDTELLRVGYQSMTTPNSIYDYDISKRSLQLLKQQEVIGDFDPENYVSERVYAEARDGVKVPISLVYRKGFEKNASAPLLLYGYGSYGNSMEPYFSSVRLSLLDRGFVYAIAHIRGGEEMGRHWYEDGKLLKKKNTFTDFIDCGDYLVKEKYANKEQVYAMGGSAGGLLMGAIINMRPEMFRGVVAAVPFVDVITTMLDESIPLTTGEFDEWGNPKDKEYYDYIKSYSPYDNVVAKDYPNMLVTTGLHDSQVQYWEPAKWVAKLREFKTDDNKLLLHTNMKAGHSGASGRFRRYKETALQYAFFLDLAGKDETTMKN